MALWAVGDVQGCMASLTRLLARLELSGSDRLWLTGDLVNRGPRSLEVLRWARDQGDRVVAVLGNHDLHLLACAAGVRRPRKKDTLAAVLDAPDRDDLIAWLRRRPLLHRDGDRLMVHAGLLPAWTVAQAEELAGEVEQALRGPRWTDLLGDWGRAPAAWRDGLAAAPRRALAMSALATLRCVTDDGAMDRDFDGPPAQAPAGRVAWFDHPARRSRDARVVCGHWASLGLLVRADLAALDSGCVWGDRLSALRLDDGSDRVVQQPCADVSAAGRPAR